MTNYEKIKAMSIEDLSKFLADTIYCKFCPAKKNCNNNPFCRMVLIQWLESESEEE